MINRNLRVEEEDATSLGGWLFADSFLALMIIFLATISFVPALGGTVSGGSNIGNIGGNNYVKGLNLVYEDFNADLIKSDIANYIKLEGLSGNSQVIYAKIVGGFDANTESEEQGRFRALLFSAKITKYQLRFFENSKIDLGSNKLLKPNQVVLRLTVAG